MLSTQKKINMRKVCQLILFIAPMTFFLPYCKKDDHDVARPALQPSSHSIKVDTTFELTASQATSYTALMIEKTISIPALENIINPDLWIYRTFLVPSSSTQEIKPFPYDQFFTLAPHYIRNKGLITYSELVIGYSSVKFNLHIIAAW